MGHKLYRYHLITHKGGTYMTLLNTVCNLGGNWPATLALWAGEKLGITFYFEFNNT